MVQNNFLHVRTAKPLHNITIGPTVLCCFNQVVAVRATFCIEPSETVANMCCCGESDAVSNDSHE